MGMLPFKQQLRWLGWNSILARSVAIQRMWWRSLWIHYWISEILNQFCFDLTLLQSLLKLHHGFKYPITKEMQCLRGSKFIPVLWCFKKAKLLQFFACFLANLFCQNIHRPTPTQWAWVQESWWNNVHSWCVIFLPAIASFIKFHQFSRISFFHMTHMTCWPVFSFVLIFKAARLSVKQLLDGISFHFRRFCCKKQIPCPELYYIKW